MKKGLFASYVAGVCDTQHGESYGKIFRYFIPEFITALVLYSMLYILDAYWIADLKSTSLYATLGVTNTLLHFIMKIAEGVGVGAVIVTGLHNGAGRYKQAGRSFVDAFWATLISGLIIASILFFGAELIYRLYGVPEDMIKIGVPFLRLRAVGVFLMYMYFSFVGFLRGVKNTRTPMNIFIVGAIVFLISDYVLIFGKWGFPQMGLMGSATASILQYSMMLLSSALVLLFSKRYRAYAINLLSVFSSGSQFKKIVQKSWVITLDKATVAGAYIWLGSMLTTLGTNGQAAFAAVKDLERLALLPACACAQVITFLVSNDCGIKNWDGIKANIKKILFISSFMVFAILLVFSLWPAYFVSFFDKNGDFTWLAAPAVPLLSVLVFFDVVQLILAGAMRGSSNVMTVMMTRVLVCIGFFAPVSYIFSIAPIQNPLVKFVLIYGSFYVGSALMGLAYINRFRGEEWKKRAS